MLMSSLLGAIRSHIRWSASSLTILAASLATGALLSACAAPPSRPVAASPRRACWIPPVSGRYLVRYYVTANYSPRDRGAAFELVRTSFRRALEEELAGSSLQLEEAQGQPHHISINISLTNDGSDNYNLEVITSPVPAVGTWMRVHHWPSTYTDIGRMVHDYAQRLARGMRDGESC